MADAGRDDLPSLRYDGGTNDAEKCDLTVDLSKIDGRF